MSKDGNEVLIAKDLTIYFGLLGVDLPVLDDPRDTLTGYTEVGYVTEDGATVARGVELLDVMADQAIEPIRREAQRRPFTITFNAEQWNAANLVLAAGGGSAYSPTAGVHRVDPPADSDPLDEVTMVIDFEDKGNEYRIVHERGNVAENTESTLSRSSASSIPITFSGLSGLGGIVDPDGNVLPWTFITNDPNFGSVS